MFPLVETLAFPLAEMFRINSALQPGRNHLPVFQLPQPPHGIPLSARLLHPPL
jgi:hypothetical protein